MGAIITVGGSGYIGSRFVSDLGNPDNLVNYDAGVLCPVSNAVIEDIRKVRIPDFTSDTTVFWFAGIHDVTGWGSEEEWRPIMREVMVDAPRRWANEIAKCGGRFVYVSSMRAQTSLDSLYGQMKLSAEAELWRSNIAILRLGTVWGDLREGWVNREHTVINRLLITPEEKIKPHTQPFYTTRMAVALRALRSCTFKHSPYWGGVSPIVDSIVPITGAALARGERPEEKWRFTRERGDTKIGISSPHPMKLYSKYYGVKTDVSND